MKDLLPEDKVVNARADEPWKKRERDYVLDLYFKGRHPSHIAVKIGRNPKAVTRLLQEYSYNERDKVLRYEVRKRLWRGGMRITENERLIIQSHAKRGIDPKMTARLLQRDPSEFVVNDTVPDHRELKHAIHSGVDLCLAHRCLTNFYNLPLITDKELAALEAEEMEFGGKPRLELMVKYKSANEVPSRIQHLALYLLYRDLETRTKTKFFHYVHFDRSKYDRKSPNT